VGRATGIAGRAGARVLALGVGLLSLVAAAPAGVLLEDHFDAVDAWSVAPADGVEGRISAAEGAVGGGLRLDFNFRTGAGFCAVRRKVDLTLPANYRFTFQIRGLAPVNNLEFKLVDPTGDSVWWVNRRSYEFPRDWTTIRYKARQFQFAWGPAAGRRLERIGAIEFTVASATGGEGTIWLDELTFEELPESAPPWPATAQYSSVRAACAAPPEQVDAAGVLAWSSATSDGTPHVRLDFARVAEFGGLVLDWGEQDYATAYEVLGTTDGKSWTKLAAVAGGSGGHDYLLLPDAEATSLRLLVQQTSRQQGVQLQGLRVMPPDFGDSPNNMYRTIAAEAPRGWYPRYCLQEQATWTVVGVPDDAKEALLDADGALEVDKLSFRLEPFVWQDGKLLTWADGTARQALADGYVPIPTVTRRQGDLELTVTALADGDAGASRLLVRYGVTNRGTVAVTPTLFVALRPLQVLPPWQELNITGGVAKVMRIACDDDAVRVNDDKTVELWSRPAGCGAAPFAQGDVVEYLARGQLPGGATVDDPAGLASAGLRYDLELAPGASREVVLAVPFYPARAAAQMAETQPAPTSAPGRAAAERWNEVYTQVYQRWAAELSRVQLRLPASAAQLVNTFRTTQAYVLINADGPAIQPGSRSYERSWIRDGALTSTALLYTRHAERVRAFADWYSGHLLANGKVPCVVDRRGPDPVPEHDSTGEYLYLLLKYYQFTRDREFLADHLPQVVAGVDYLRALRAERLTDEYRAGPPEKRACYGLVPESISHEGYSAKPMHSYWDDFFTLRGLKDATTIAELLGQAGLAQRCARERDDFRKCLYDSLRLAIELKHIDYIPGCVELGDFDATSTTIALWPCGELDALPQPALRNTFDRYYQFACDRRDGRLDWVNYTPYELRTVGSFVRLGAPRRAHELLDFFFRDQRPQGWNHWGEVVWREPNTPKFIGDMPHTWVGSDYLNAIRSLFVYEREGDQALVLAAGVRAEWLDDAEGVKVGGFPTEYGAVSYELRQIGDELRLTLRASGDLPPGGIVLRNALGRPFASATLDQQSIAKATETEVQGLQLGGEVVVRLGASQP
jgi:hypothetical protein